jgi:hypothetical protein
LLTKQQCSVDLITDIDETAYREEVRDLAVWCQDNNLSLNVSKTKEQIVDYRKRRAKQAPINITNELSWSKHTKTDVKVGTTIPIPPQETKKNCHGSPDSQSYTAAPSRAS